MTRYTLAGAPVELIPPEGRLLTMQELGELGEPQERQTWAQYIAECRAEGEDPFGLEPWRDDHDCL